MFKSWSLSNISFMLLFVLVIVTSIRFSQATSLEYSRRDDISDSSNDEVQEQRQTYNLDKLRHFLLTSNEEQRTARRDKQNFFKRKLIREYLQAINDQDSNRFEDIKKRFITFCNSYEDIMNPDRATCG